MMNKKIKIMKNIKVLLIVTIFLILNSCGFLNKHKIKKELNSRFSNFKIIEFKKDSANVVHAKYFYYSVSINVKINHLEISKLLLNYNSKKSEIDSLFNDIVIMMYEFEKMKFSKEEYEPCYYVKYRITNGIEKITKEEYFYINKNNNIIHRSYDWNEFLYELKYDELIEEVIEFQKDWQK